MDSGKWFTVEGHICYRYFSDYDNVFCHNTFKKDGKVIFAGSNVITLKRGDTENLQQAYLPSALKLSSSEIKRLFAGKTAYFPNGEIEYTREDGVTFYNYSKRRIRLGQWFTEKSHICYRYFSDYDQISCHKTFKTDGQVIYDGNVISLLKRGDTEKLQKAYLSQEPCQSWAAQVSDKTYQEFLPDENKQWFAYYLSKVPWTKAVREKVSDNITKIYVYFGLIDMTYTEVALSLMMIQSLDRVPTCD